jgi:hypothetical protein
MKSNSKAVFEINNERIFGAPRQKPGFPGLRYRSGPACGGAACVSLQSGPHGRAAILRRQNCDQSLAPHGLATRPKTQSGLMRFFMALLVSAAALFSCASQAPQKTAALLEYSADSLTLDAAIADTAAYFIGKLPAASAAAIVSCEAPTPGLSDYVFAELWNRFEASGKFVMVDRRNLDLIRKEILYQASGEVNDESARAIGKQYGPQVIVYGRLAVMGGEYRLTMYASDVEKAVSLQRALVVRPDGRLNALLEAGLDEQVDGALEAMARALADKTTIAVGRIAYMDTQSVSSLSAYLKNSITAGALKRQGKFAVASDAESAEFAVATRGLLVETPAANSSIQAVVQGSFSPVDDNAEVSLRLVSTGQGKIVLASAGFIVSAAELKRRRLSLLPEKDTAVISKAEFEAKRTATGPYAGGGNAFEFTVTPDDLDGVYYDGEYMSMRIYSGRDCYFRIVHVDVNGTAQVIYPLAAGDNNFIRAGQTRSIPDRTRFRMGPPFGEEYILVAAYDKPFRPAQGRGEQLSGEAVSRGLVVEEQSAGAQMSPVATAKFSYTILPRN